MSKLPRQFRVLIDASNLHVGGGVQVAASLLNELHELRHEIGWLQHAHFRASDEVARNLRPECLQSVEIRNQHFTWGFIRPPSHQYDIEYSVFGPNYRRREAPRALAGLADPSLPASSPIRPRTPHDFLRRSIKRWIVRRLDAVVVESELFARAITTFGVDSNNILVVPNAVAQLTPAPTRLPPRSADLRAFYPARPYPHKNHNFLGATAKALHQRHGLTVEFLVTLTPAEVEKLDPATKACVVPLGVVSVAQCHGLYGVVDAVFFPSLSEVSSATPIEAMMYGTPLALSDRDFLRESARESAVYFDPHNPETAADALAQVVEDSPQTRNRRELGCALVGKRPSANDRASRIAALISSFAE